MIIKTEEWEVFSVKKDWLKVLVMALAIALLASVGALAEGMEIEGADVFAPEVSSTVEELGEVDLFAPEGEDALALPGTEEVAVEAAEAAGVAIDSAHFPDRVFREFIAGSDYDWDRDGFLSDDERLAVTSFDIPEKGIVSLQGIEYFEELQWLNCSDNKLTKLSLSKNKNLKELWAFGNKIKTIDLKNCATLRANLKLKKEKVGDQVVWRKAKEDYSYAKIYIDATTKLTSGKKVLYKGK